jgi:hypothetical protein
MPYYLMTNSTVTYKPDRQAGMFQNRLMASLYEHLDKLVAGLLRDFLFTFVTCTTSSLKVL